MTALIAFGGTVLLENHWRRNGGYRGFLFNVILTGLCVAVLWACGGNPAERVEAEAGTETNPYVSMDNTARDRAETALKEVWRALQETSRADMESKADTGKTDAPCLWAPREILEYARMWDGAGEDASFTLLYGRNLWDKALNAYTFDVYPEEMEELYLWMEESARSADTAETEKAEKKEKAPDTSRRSFLLGAALATTAATIGQEKQKVDGGLAAIEKKVAPMRTTPLTPPGSMSAKNMATRCTACQLCVSACPNGVLRPSTDLMTFMQPKMAYERGYCRPECTECADVCPAGAIKPITKEEKSSIQIGHAVWTRELCVPIRDGQECGNCSRHCPTSAITMVPLDADDPDSLKIPVVNEEMCIGCGTCEALCPSRPLSAIYVEGHEVHRII